VLRTGGVQQEHSSRLLISANADAEATGTEVICICMAGAERTEIE
jgi:hypothetical protein